MAPTWKGFAMFMVPQGPPPSVHVGGAPSGPRALPAGPPSVTESTPPHLLLRCGGPDGAGWGVGLGLRPLVPLHLSRCLLCIPGSSIGQFPTGSPAPDPFLFFLCTSVPRVFVGFWVLWGFFVDPLFLPVTSPALWGACVCVGR